MTYDEFISNIIKTRGRFACGDEYHERHHVIPKCLGGTNKKDNLIDLYAKEHYIAHKLLAEEHPDNIGLVRAFNALSHFKNSDHKRYKLSPEEYEEMRILVSSGFKNYYKDKTNHPCYGKKLSEETKRKISKSHKGLQSSLGRILSEETKRKISLSNTNPSPEKRKHMSEAQKRARVGAGSSTAKKMIRLSDGKIYDCGIYAAKENNINYSTFRSRIRRGRGDFRYYEDWLKQRR